MFYRVRERWNRFRFARAVEGILSSSPLVPRNDRVLIVSSVSHLDLLMYLVAIKSFVRYFGEGAAVILNDGTLTPSDLRLLEKHVAPREVLLLDEVPYRGGRKGVRWGIMLAIADRLDDHFVVQLDSDTVTRGPIPEVVEAVKENCSFTLTSREDFTITPIRDISEMMKHTDSTHVQKVIERNFHRLPHYDRLRYVRGNSGLAGFARGAFTRCDVEDYYEGVTEAIGEKSLERGSYQVSSNFFVANSPRACVLPIRRYANVTPANDTRSSSFLHFIGRHRFETEYYRAVARCIVDDLQMPAVRPQSEFVHCTDETTA